MSGTYNRAAFVPTLAGSGWGQGHYQACAIKWEIDNRVSVQFFKDPWVGSSPLNFWLNVVPQNTIDADIKVKEFISPSRQWDRERLTEKAAVANMICRLPLPNGHVEDRRRFLGAELGVYSIQKAYMLLTSPAGPHDLFDWKWIWRLSCSQRIRAWCWKVFKGCVPMRDLLYSRGLASTMRCQHCNNEVENLRHLLLCH